MQHVAFDPFAAVQQRAQRVQRRIEPVEGAERLFERVAGAHLVGHGANATDARRDIGHGLELLPAEKGLKEPGWLVDIEPHLAHAVAVHFQMQRAFAFDAGQRRHANHAFICRLGLLARVVHSDRLLA